jgi:ribosomal protein L37AE/L43A
MECPHCKYKNGWMYNDNDEFVEFKGESGEFFKLYNDLELKRGRDFDQETRNLYGCPNCDKTFIN